MHCECYGDECVEINCPFMERKTIFFDLLGDDSFLLEENAIARMPLQECQVQHQLLVTKKNYCCTKWQLF